MIDASNASLPTLSIRVELFGSARMVCGYRHIEVDLQERAKVRDLISALVEKCPDLLGKVFLEDGTGLLQSYTLNVNGTEFVSGEALRLKQGDTLLLFSSQAGG